MRYALIENGIVKNIIWLYPGNAKEFPGAVSVDGIPAGIGDEYRDGVFYRGGEKLLTTAEQMYLDAAKAAAEAAEAEAAYREGVQEA